MAWFKLTWNGELLGPADRVDGPGFAIDATTPTTDTPDGWQWFASTDAAAAALTPSTLSTLEAQLETLIGALTTASSLAKVQAAAKAALAAGG